MKTGIRLLLAFAAIISVASAQAPKIDKIDPPDWWAGLPDPMLLVYGENLREAKFSVRGEGVAAVREQASENGHYAFLWLSGEHSSPQTLQIQATNPAGTATAKYEWRRREPGT
jgi:hypothetical protein